MKKLRILLSALLICCLLPVGAGAADTLSQMQLTRQCIAHFQQERPSEGDNEWRIDEFVVSAWSLNIRRDEFCTLAVQMLRAADPDKLPQTERAFPDCEDADVMRIAALGIVNGYEDGTFQPDRDISREEAAVILHRLYRVMYGEITADPVRYDDDSSIGLWAKESVYAMWQAGVMQGEGQNQFHPENGYTCEQAIATMLRMTMIEV